ncbi:sulfurtransferase [Chenggangzhangella methanolivorans]|uniref:Sulfurtransferase n=1 Tax=Chenggangzhangella methanolivorans TaxID=1437009 RepID=A0A9E6R7W7_9HYPH|nr:sulfurtransferase [Chenggangzhangella methanolivorans]QZN99845.1 sulfurtransferase [Chenggangzhangella methanolivorans]
MSFIKSFAAAGAALLVSAGTAFAQAGPLVTADWVADNLKNPKVKVFEVSVDPGVYERGHVPGATNIRWHSELVDPIKRDIASRENLQKLLSSAGVDKDTTIVLYGDNNNWFAAWGAWVLEAYGLGDRVKLLDGGRKVWEAKGLPLDTGTPEAAKGSVELTQVNAKVRARLGDVLKVAEGDTGSVLLDIRSPDEFSGKIFAPEGSKELSIRAGHVPGAKNVPWSKAVNADGTLKSKDELKKLYADAGVDGSKPTIVYCRIGERSSHTWFVLAKVLGYEVKNYDGSWTEYGNSVGVPVANLTGTVWQGK